MPAFGRLSCKRTPMEEEIWKRWSDRSLQVDDLKATGALSCFHIIVATYRTATSITLAHSCMHHAPSDGAHRSICGVR